MKSLLKALGAVALTGTIALADDAKDQKDLKKVIQDQGINYVETAQKGITLSGYVDVSYTEQFGGRGTGFGGNESKLHEFDRSNDNFNVNAVKIALEKALPDKNEWAAGFRIDLMAGADAKILGATDPELGSGDSGLYVEQALVKFRIPVGNGLDIYAGKFVTFLGYEVIESPANLNFSRGLLFTNAIPLTHTGVYADYKFNDTVEAKFGVVDGWNNSSSTPTPGGTTDYKNDYPFGGKAITGQLNINAPGKNANITQSFIYSPSGESGNGASGFGTDNGPVAVYDIWGNWNPTFVKDSALTLGFNFDVGYNGMAGVPATSQTVGPGPVFKNFGATAQDNTYWGAALYSSYKFSKLFTLSARGEYLHSGNHNTTSPYVGVAGCENDDVSETITGTFNIWDNLLTRVEYRYDHLTTGTKGDATIAKYDDQNEISAEAVYSF